MTFHVEQAFQRYGRLKLKFLWDAPSLILRLCGSGNLTRCTWVPPHLEDGGKAGERPCAILDRAVLRLCVLQLQL